MDRAGGYLDEEAQPERRRFGVEAYAADREEDMPLWAEEVVPMKRPRTFATVFHYTLAVLMLSGGFVLLGLGIASAKSASLEDEVLGSTGGAAVSPLLLFASFASISGAGVGLIILGWASFLATDSDGPCGLLSRVIFVVAEFSIMLALIFGASRIGRAEEPTGAAVPLEKIYLAALKSGTAARVCNIERALKCAGWETGDCEKQNSAADECHPDQWDRAVCPCPDCSRIGIEVDSSGGSVSCQQRIKELHEGMEERHAEFTSKRRAMVAFAALASLILLLDLVCVVFIFPCLQIKDDRRVLVKTRSGTSSFRR